MSPARILTIAGLDSSGGAGIAADLKTIERLGAYGLVAVTAVTAQDTAGVRDSHLVPGGLVTQQIEAAFGDIGVDAAKCGMLGGIEAVRAVVAHWRQDQTVPLVVDPVLVSTSGTSLLSAEGQRALQRELLPLAALVTPNLPEAEALTGRPVGTMAERRQAAWALVGAGAAAVLIKGGHGSEPLVEDLLYDGQAFTVFASPRRRTRHTHGTGCTLSAAISTGLGQGMDLRAATERAVRYLQAAMAHAPGLGHGRGPLGHQAGQPPWGTGH